MAYKPLIPCEGCHRHVLAAETACPFCGEAREAQVVRAVAPPKRATRGALYTFGAALIIAGCGSTTGGENNTPADGGASQDVARTPGDSSVSDAGARDAGSGPDVPAARDASVEDVGGPVAAYGAPPDRDAGPRDSGPDDDGGAMAEYGAPPDDGGTNADYGAPPDRDGGGIAPLYGLPPNHDAGQGTGDDGGGGGGVMPLYGAPPDAGWQ